MNILLVSALALEEGKLLVAEHEMASLPKPASVMTSVKSGGLSSLREFSLCKLGAASRYAAMAFVAPQNGKFVAAERHDFDDDICNEIEHYPLYKKAVEFADQAHGAQTYSSLGLPYSYHLRQAEKVLDYYYDELPVGKAMVLRVAARLHDVLEDTEVTKRMMANEFGAEITTIVENVTKRGDEDEPGFEEAYYAKVAQTPLSVLTKIADKCANAKQTVRAYSPWHAQKMLGGHDLFTKAAYDKVDCLRMKSYLDGLVEKIDALARQRSASSLTASRIKIAKPD